MQKVLMMAGGTGGHVFPALAIARALREQGIEVAWLGTPRGLENTVVPAENIALYTISVKAVRGKGWRRRLLTPWQLSRSLWQVFRVLRAYKPDMVIGMGGFVTGPGGVMSWLMRKPLYIHEQNAVFGLTNRWLSRVATRVFTGFPLEKGYYVGNPVRQDILAVPPPEQRFASRTGKPFRLLVVGGSQGARIFNQVVPGTIAKLPCPIEVWHQTGAQSDFASQPHYQIEPFIADMAAAYAWADLVLCRAGALTVSELCAVGMGAILVPYPHAVDDHQTANAQKMVQAGAAILLPDSDCNVPSLSTLLTNIMTDRPRLLKMAQAARALRKEGSEMIEEVLKGVRA